MKSPRSIRPILGTLASWVLLSGVAAATITMWTVTGTMDSPESGALEGFFGGGEAFTLTFTLDDSAPGSGLDDDVSFFGDAASDIGLSIEDFSSETPYDLTSPFGDVLTARNPGNHQFSFDFFPFAPSIPDLSGFDFDGGEDDLFFNGVNFAVLDFTESLLSETPPELLTPDSSLVLSEDSSSFIVLDWSDSEDPDRFAELFGTIESVTVIPEPSVMILALGGGMFGLLRRRRF